MDSLFPAYCCYSNEVLQFYELTLGELTLFITSKARYNRDMQLQQAHLDYINNSNLVSYLSKMLGGKGDIPSFKSLYAHLIDSEIKKQMEEQEQEYNLIRLKASLMAYADSHNQKGGK